MDKDGTSLPAIQRYFVHLRAKNDTATLLRARPYLKLLQMRR
jgi:hypothetical protein